MDLDKTTLWLLIHTHRHGEDVFPLLVVGDEPLPDEEVFCEMSGHTFDEDEDTIRWEHCGQISKLPVATDGKFCNCPEGSYCSRGACQRPDT